MINVVLAAGYATRMYPLTKDFPKPLLTVKGRTILDSLLEDVDAFPEIEKHVVVTNHKFYHHFEKWKASSSYSKPIEIIDDGSVDNENRIGAVRDMLLAINATGAVGDYLVLAADNLLDFSLKGFVDYFYRKGTSVIMRHFEPSLKALRRTGVVCLDEDEKVLLMEEKPQEPKSNWAVPPFYIYSGKDMPLILDCMQNGCGFDAPGNLAHYLCERSVVHSWQMPGKRIDIGDLETYEKMK